MRQYAQLMPVFYKRGSGKKLRGKPLAQALAPYLFAAPSGNMIGLFFLELTTIAHDLGWSMEQVRQAMAEVEAAGIARYDSEDEIVFLPEGANYQMSLKGMPIRVKDKRRPKVEADLAALGDHDFVDQFRSRYLPDTASNHDRGNDTAKGHPYNSEEASAVVGRGPVPAPVPVPVGGAGGGDVREADLGPEAKDALDEIRRHAALAPIVEKIHLAEQLAKLVTSMAVPGIDFVRRGIRRAAEDVAAEAAGEGGIRAGTIAKIVISRCRTQRDFESRQGARRAAPSQTKTTRTATIIDIERALGGVG